MSLKLPRTRDAIQNTTASLIEKEDSQNVKKRTDNRITGALILQSPDGSWWRIKVDDTGAVYSEEVPA